MRPVCSASHNILIAVQSAHQTGRDAALPPLQEGAVLRRFSDRGGGALLHVPAAVGGRFFDEEGVPWHFLQTVTEGCYATFWANTSNLL